MRDRLAPHLASEMGDIVGWSVRSLAMSMAPANATPSCSQQVTSIVPPPPLGLDSPGALLQPSRGRRGTHYHGSENRASPRALRICNETRALSQPDAVNRAPASGSRP